jgi:hypothetical protein
LASLTVSADSGGVPSVLHAVIQLFGSAMWAACVPKGPGQGAEYLYELWQGFRPRSETGGQDVLYFFFSERISATMRSARERSATHVPGRSQDMFSKES